MRRLIFLFLTLTAVSAGLVSCLGELTVQQRRYRPGLHVEWKGKPAPGGVPAEQTAAGPVVPAVAAEPAQVDHAAHPEYRAASAPVATETVEKEKAEFSGVAQRHPDASATERPGAPSGIVRTSGHRAESHPPATLPWALGGGLLAAAGAVQLGRRRVFRMAHWARQHRLPSWLWIGGANVALGLGAFLAGRQEALWGSTAWPHAGEVAAGVAAAAALTYPLRRSRGNADTLFRRKAWDALLLASGLVLLFQSGHHTLSIQGEAPAWINTHAELWPFATSGATADLSAAAQAPSTGDKVVLTLLTLVLVAGLAFVVFAISCNLACSGNTVAANAVAFAGSTLILLLALELLRRIWSEPYRERRRARREAEREKARAAAQGS